jgi:Tfp pilus assembly protein FimV
LTSRTTERARPVPASSGSGYHEVSTRPGRAGARVRRARRERRIAGLFRFAVFLLLIFVAVWAGVRVANATDATDAFDGRAYEVHRGETLWRIAEENYDGDLDLRAVVYAIREANDLDGALLQPGQTLTLPYLGE